MGAVTPAEPDATFVFADIAGFTALTEAHGDEAAADLVVDFAARIGEIAPAFDAELVKTAGDAVMLRAAQAANGVGLASTSPPASPRRRPAARYCSASGPARSGRGLRPRGLTRASIRSGHGSHPRPNTPRGYATVEGMSTMATPVRGYTASKEQLLKRLARIEGQVRGVAAMVQDDRYCIDVLTQIAAIQAALDKVALGLLDGHARHCVAGAAGGERAEKTDELMGAVGRLLGR